MAGREIKDWLRQASMPFRHWREDADLQEELRVHLELQTEDQAGQGLSPEEAHRRARLKLGSARAVAERVQDQELLTMLESCYRDLLLGIRALRKNPVFCLTAILTLAAGIGANTVVFTLLYGLLLRSLPVQAPQQLVRIGTVDRTRPRPAASIPYRMMQQLRRTQSSFADISGWRAGTVTLDEGDGTPRLYMAGFVSGNGFELLGISPRLGRLIAPSDDLRGGPAGGWPVVLSYGFWADRFGRDPGVIGRPLRVGNRIATVVGVTAAGFQGVWPGIDSKLYFPLAYLSALPDANGPLADLDSPASFIFCGAIARLKPGLSLAEANAEIHVREKDLLNEFLPPEWKRLPVFQSAGLTVESARTGLPTGFGRQYAEPLFLMQGLVAIVLLLCCVNVSGLMLSKIQERQHEFAVRTAIGAARWRLVRQYLTESLVIAAAGAALGAAAAWYGTPLLLPFFRDPNWFTGMSVQPDRTIFLITGAFAILTTLLCGILPARRAGRSDPGALLRTRTAGAQSRRIGRIFVAAQIALSLLLVMLASLLSESLTRLRSQRTGFDLDHITIQTPPFNTLPQHGEAKLDLYQRMVDRIEQSSAVQSAAVTWYTPMTGSQATAAFQAIGDRASEDSTMAYNFVGPGYFRTMGTKILTGREFERNERKHNVCVVNQSGAALLFGRQAPVGQYVRSLDEGHFAGGVACRVVGMAEDATFASLREPPPPTVYFPVAEDVVDQNLVFLIHSRTKADAITAYRTALREIAPTIPLVLFATLREQMDASLGSQRAITLLSNVFGVVALSLSAIGLYGMLSSSITQRTAEIGVRVALGARRGTVIRMVLFDALRLAAWGMLAGAVVLGFALGYVQHLLYGISPLDPATLAGVSAALLLVVLLAALIPAARAASIDPIRALRAE